MTRDGNLGDEFFLSGGGGGGGESGLQIPTETSHRFYDVQLTVESVLHLIGAWLHTCNFGVSIIKSH